MEGVSGRCTKVPLHDEQEEACYAQKWKGSTKMEKPCAKTVLWSNDLLVYKLKSRIFTQVTRLRSTMTEAYHVWTQGGQATGMTPGGFRSRGPQLTRWISNVSCGRVIVSVNSSKTNAVCLRDGSADANVNGPKMKKVKIFNTTAEQNVGRRTKMAVLKRNCLQVNQWNVEKHVGNERREEHQGKGLSLQHTKILFCLT